MSILRTPRLRTAGVLTAITMTALLAACSAGTDDHQASSADMSESEGVSDGSGGSSAGGRAEAPSATSRELGDAPADAGTSSAKGPTTPEMERSVISSGTVSLASDDVSGTRRDVQRIVDEQGGEIAEESTETETSGEASYSRLVVRVPSAKFGATMEALEAAGVLRSSSRGSEDVTTQVLDTGVRVRAQQASLKRVELLLAEARSLKDVIWIESQLTGRQAELDSLKSQQSWLADQTSLSTITVDISRREVVEDEPGGHDEPAGFLSGLDGGMRAMDATFVAVTTVLGALLPFAVVALVLGLPAWLVVRRRRAASASVPAADA
ncbi:DUF4349 domain-containing protein [Nocardioides hwasunensis]|uniref:DUF4349 domain-containing protein n=1 Tax=Nocardioides hwasunensis TaxID=397258 RepID=A0ABR8MMH0_9ACTN|nr:DUF4349 domain-containing protein [Nocardioides hwasunensis]MBD3915274.1 DUF4349 domain-containing protein [Nocardioides hwasunensis]